MSRQANVQVCWICRVLYQVVLVAQKHCVICMVAQPGFRSSGCAATAFVAKRFTHYLDRHGIWRWWRKWPLSVTQPRRHAWSKAPLRNGGGHTARPGFAVARRAAGAATGVRDVDCYKVAPTVTRSAWHASSEPDAHRDVDGSGGSDATDCSRARRHRRQLCVAYLADAECVH